MTPPPGQHVPTVLLCRGASLQARRGAHHAGGELQQLPLGLLHALWVPFDADQVALFAVRRDAHRHFVLVFDSVDLRTKGNISGSDSTTGHQ